MRKPKPKAIICHEIPNRVRIRILNKINDPLYFERAREDLGQLEGVQRVEVKLLTGSVLIYHRLGRESFRGKLNQFLSHHPLFKIVKEKESAEIWTHKLFSEVKSLDGYIKKNSQNQWDLDTVVAVGMLGLGVYQAFKRRFLPPAWTLGFEACLALSRKSFLIRSKS